MHVRFTQINKRVAAAAPGDLLLAKALSSAVSVVKADRVQGGAATNVALFPGSCAWAEKIEAGTHCLHMLSSPRISGNFGISVKPVRYTNLGEICRLFMRGRCLPLTTLCVDDDEGAIKAISSSLTGIIYASVHSS